MATDLDTLLKQFLRERKYLRNVSPDTIDWYECAWKAFKGSATHCLTDPAALKRADLDQFIQRASPARDEPGAEVIETVLRPVINVYACMFCITALDKKIVGRWNAIDNSLGAV